MQSLQRRKSGGWGQPPSRNGAMNFGGSPSPATVHPARWIDLEGERTREPVSAARAPRNARAGVCAPRPVKIRVHLRLKFFGGARNRVPPPRRASCHNYCDMTPGGAWRSFPARDEMCVAWWVGLNVEQGEKERVK